MNTYYLGGTSMDLIKELNKERLEAEVTPVKAVSYTHLRAHET